MRKDSNDSDKVSILKRFFRKRRMVKDSSITRKMKKKPSFFRKIFDGVITFFKKLFGIGKKKKKK